MTRRIDAASDRIPDLGATVQAAGGSADELPAVEELARSLHDTLDRALTSSFSRSFLLAGLLALAALFAISTRESARSPAFRSLVPIAAAIALAVPIGYTALGGGRYTPASQ